MRKILIATSNPGKFQEFITEYKDLPLDFVGLRDLKLDKIKLDEPYQNLWENALHKAKFFALKSGLPTIAEDTGFFIDHLQGAPGIYANRYAATGQKRIQKVLKALKGVPKSKRGAYFQTDACLYDPERKSFSVFTGKVEGQITENQVGVEREGMDYDAIFYYPPFQKNFSELTLLEKNQVSHRGQTIHQLKHHLSKYYRGQQPVVAVGLIVKNRRLLLTKRRDSRPAFNGRFEFPGGMIEFGESPKRALLREIKEETGYSVKIIQPLAEVVTRHEKKYNYQVFLLLYLCKVQSGKFVMADHETSGYGWFTLKEAVRQKLLPLNKECIENNIKLLKKYID